MLEPVLRLLLNYVSDPRFGELVCDLAGIITGMCIEFVNRDHAYASFRHVLPSDRPVAADRYPFSKTSHETQGRVEVPKRIGAVTRSSRDGDGHLYTATVLNHALFVSYFVHVRSTISIYIPAHPATIDISVTWHLVYTTFIS